MDWNTFYSRVRNKVVDLVKASELNEGTLNIGHIIDDVMKEGIIEDLGLKRKVVKKYGFPDKNILYRDDSRRRL